MCSHSFAQGESVRVVPHADQDMFAKCNEITAHDIQSRSMLVAVRGGMVSAVMGGKKLAMKWSTSF